MVLEALSIRVGDNVTTDWLADALWGETRPRRPPRTSRAASPGFGRLGPDAIETTASGYRLALPATDVDSHAFEHLVQRARELLARASRTGRRTSSTRR